MSTTHAFTDPKADGGDTTIVRPTDWNAAHVGTNDHAHSATADGGTVSHAVLTSVTATDHHAAPAAGPDADTTIDTAGAAGTASTFARSGHGHKVATYATAAAAIGTAAAGTSGQSPSRGDHVHPTGAGTPSTQAFGDAASTGSGPAAAMTDHKHAMPSSPVTLAVNAIVLGSTAAAGAASTLMRSDDTIAAFDATVPVTQAFADAAATGSAAKAARRDHVHGMPANPVRSQSSTTPAAIGTAAVGTGTTDARSDHVHATGAGTPVTQAFGDAAATGSGPAAAMTDHKHAMPANPVSFATNAITLASAATAGSAGTLVRSDAAIAAFDATSPSTQAFGDSAVVGTAAFAARRDHKHAMPANPVRSQSSTTPADVGAAAVGTGTTDARSDHVHGLTDTLNVVFDGGGIAITVGKQVGMYFHYACTITEWEVLAIGASGAIVLDGWKDTYANHPPTIADTFVGAEKPTITATASKGQDTSLNSGSGWSVAAGSVVIWNVDSCTSITMAVLALKIIRA